MHLLLSLMFSLLCGGADFMYDGALERAIAGMSLEQKVAQMFVVRPEAADSVDRSIASPGGYCVFAHNFSSPQTLAQLLERLNAQDCAPLLCIDEEGGRVARIGGNESFGVRRFPPMQTVGRKGEEAAIEAGRTIGEYLGRYGLNVDFAPVADVNTNPSNPVIGTRAFSSDPAEASSMVCAFLRGLGSMGIAGCLKHFPGHGDTATDSHLGYAESRKTWEEMLSCEMLPFRAGVDAGVPMVMVGHISTPMVEGCGSLPATLSATMIQGKLRGELHFTGIVITDSMAMGAISAHYSTDVATLMAVKAGVDIVLMPKDFAAAYNALLGAVRSGEISEARLDESLRRILSLKFRLGLLK